MNRILASALLGLAVAGCATGPYDQPYSIITTDTKPSADFHLRPVFVNRVDGQNSGYRNQHVVAPGPHDVTVDLPPRAGFREPTQHTFPLVTQPCVRYYVAARVSTPVTQHWEPVIRSTEPIGECRARFRIAER